MPREEYSSDLEVEVNGVSASGLPGRFNWITDSSWEREDSRRLRGYRWYYLESSTATGKGQDGESDKKVRESISRSVSQRNRVEVGGGLLRMQELSVESSEGVTRWLRSVGTIVPRYLGKVGISVQVGRCQGLLRRSGSVQEDREGSSKNASNDRGVLTRRYIASGTCHVGKYSFQSFTE